jgi:adenosylhomocysteine nucleosidase
MVFVAAEAREFGGLLSFCGKVARLDWPLAWARVAELNGRKVFLAANGAGPKLAAEAVEIARLQVGSGDMDAVVSTGFCGGLDPAMKVGDVFAATGIQLETGLEPVSAPQSRREFFKGTLVSRDRVAQTAEEKRDLRRSGASAVDMEAAGVLSRVREWGVPFYCVRSVTDLVDESFHIDLNSARSGDGRFSTARILVAAIRRPVIIAPELLELRRRCALAAHSLGEFIADCSF